MIIFVEVEGHDQEPLSFYAQLDLGLCFLCRSVTVVFPTHGCSLFLRLITNSEVIVWRHAD